MRSQAILLLVGLALAAPAASAADNVRLAEVLPALQGTDLGELELGPAPLPGQTRTVRGSEIRAALRAAGRSVDGLAIPSHARISRTPRHLDASALEALVTPALAEALAPCQLDDIAAPARTTVMAGALDVSVERAPMPARGGRTSATVLLSRAGFERRVVLSLAVTCPPPAVSAGDAVTIRARAGNVVASIPGTALQPGRAGDVIRVSSRRDAAAVTRNARVVAAGVVEVVQ